jgi:hypothetical protein
MIDALIGGDSSRTYHTSNLVIHIFVCVAIYFLLQFFGINNLTAFFLTLIFSVHPLLASAVSWIPARGDLLIGLWGILLFLTFGSYLSNGKKSTFILHTIIFFLAVFSKETTILFPVLLLFYYFYVKREKINLQVFLSWKKLLPFLIVWISIPVFYLILRNKIIPGIGPNYIFGITSFFHNLPTIPITFGKVFIPINLTTLPLFDNVSIIIGIAVALIIIYFFIKQSKEKKRLYIFGLIWFILFTIPPMMSSTIIADHFFNYTETRTYLPIMGLMVFSSFYFDNLSFHKNTKHLIYYSLVVIIIFTVTAFIHSSDYSNPFNFFNSAIEHNPNNAEAYRLLGDNKDDIKDYNGAIEDYNKAIELNQNYFAAYNNRGVVKRKLKDYQGAIEDFTKAIKMNPNYADTYVNRGLAKQNLNDINGACSDWSKAGELGSSNAYDLIKKYCK